MRLRNDFLSKLCPVGSLWPFFTFCHLPCSSYIFAIARVQLFHFAPPGNLWVHVAELPTKFLRGSLHLHNRWHWVSWCGWKTKLKQIVNEILKSVNMLNRKYLCTCAIGGQLVHMKNIFKKWKDLKTNLNFYASAQSLALCQFNQIL